MKSAESERGRHDFDSYRVDFSALGDGQTLRHEREHNGFVAGTSFGLAQRIVGQLAISTAGNASASVLQWKLWRASHAIHERGATFCAVKSQDPEVHSELLAALPPQYSVFYNDMASVVDRCMHSSFSQYLLGKWLTNEALTPSILLPDGATFEAIGEMLLSDECHPEQRWQAMSAWLKSPLGDEFAVEVWTNFTTECGRLGIPFPASDCEAEWLELSIADAVRVDEVLSRTVSQGLREYCDTVGFVPADQLDTARPRLANALATASGASIRVETTARQALLLGDARSEIANSMQLFPHLRRMEMSPHQIVPAVVVSAFGSGALDTDAWFAGIASGEGALSFGLVASHDVQRSLATRARFAMATGFVSDLTFIVRVDPSSFEAAYERFIPYFVMGSTGKEIDLSDGGQLCWYMAGDLQSWREYLDRWGPSQFMWVGPLDDSGVIKATDDIMEVRQLLAAAPDTYKVGQAKSDEKVGVVVLRFRALAGCFIRVLPLSIIGTAAGFDDRLLQSGAFPLSSRDAVWRRLIQIPEILAGVWPTM